MKLKFRAEPKDILYFVLFAIFLFYLIAVGIGNITSLSKEGILVGLNPLPGLSSENIFSTILFLYIYKWTKNLLFLKVSKLFWLLHYIILLS